MPGPWSLSSTVRNLGVPQHPHVPGRLHCPPMPCPWLLQVRIGPRGRRPGSLQRGLLGCKASAPAPQPQVPGYTLQWGHIREPRLTAHTLTPRFLVKNYRGAREAGSPASRKSLPPSVSYLTAPRVAKCPAEREAHFLNPEIYTEAWAHMAVRLLEDSVHHLQMLVQSGADQHEAWNQTSILLLQAAKAHCYYITVKNFKEALENLEHEPAIHRVLKRLCDFFALHGILADSGSFVCDGFLSASQVDMVRTAYLDLLLQIRKDAILLTDAFDFTDQCLNSALGCYDGNVYERLFHWAQMSPNNNSQEKPAYTKYLQPLIASRDSKL